MKRIGILGGTTPESTIYYYRLMVEISRTMFEKDFYPEIVIFNLNFKKFRELESWDLKKEYMLEAIHSLEDAGAEVIGIAANTPHMVFDEIEPHTRAKMVSIIDALAEEAKRNSFKRLLLTGTKTTMTADFYREKLESYGFSVTVPAPEEMDEIERIISEELSQGILKSKDTLVSIIEKYKESIDAVILGCTELPLIITQDTVDIPVLDTARIHAKKLINEAL